MLAALQVLALFGAALLGILGSPTPAASVPVPDDAGAVLARAREALAKVDLLNYDARLTNEGPGADKLPTYQAAVTAARADAGGWRLYAKGDTGAEKNRKTIEIGYDGVIVRSIRESEKIVAERDVSTTEELASFFGTQGARPVVAWEILEDHALTQNADKARLEGKQTIDSKPCDVVFIPANTPTPDAPAVAGTRLYIDPEGLPRRIDRVSAPEKDGAKPQVRVLTLTSLRTGDQATQAPFALAVPDGFRVRTAEPEKTLPQKKTGEAAADKGTKPPAQKLGDPDNLRRSAAGLANGTPAPDFSLKDATGKTYTVADFKGKVVVMDFWGTWCGWCVKAMPSIQKLHENYQGKPVAIVGMDCEMGNKKADPIGFVRKNHYTYMQLLDADATAQAYKVNGFPMLYIIDQQGKVAFVHEGYSPTLTEDLGKVIDRLLKDQPADAGKTDKSGAAPPADPGRRDANDNKRDAPGAADPNVVVVYRTKTGTRYHLEGCDALKTSGEPITLEQAKAQGLLPCSRCKPPQ